VIYNKFLVGIIAIIVVQPVFSKSDVLSDFKSGFYTGAQGGYARTNEGSGPENFVNQFSGPKEISKGKLGGRAFIGYSFLPSFSLETGYTYYPNNYYKSINLDYKTKLRTIDFMIKGILPLKWLSLHFVNWSVFGKLGTAMTTSKSNSSSENNDKTVVKFRPSYALGVGYNFTDHFNIDVSWLGIYSSDKVNAGDIRHSCIDKIPSGNLIALGISYKF
jgi:opacity protein-like surface antigen